MKRRNSATRGVRSAKVQTSESFPVVDRFTVSGHLVGDICFSCECRVATFGCEEGMTLAWCDCDWPADAHEMQVLSEAFAPDSLLH